MNNIGTLAALIKSITAPLKNKILGIEETIEDTVENWLEENISNPDSPPLDRSLSLTSAAAPADLVASLNAPAFDSSTSYVSGRYVTYNGGLYRFITNHSGAWSSDDVKPVSIGGEVADIFGYSDTQKKLNCYNILSNFIKSNLTHKGIKFSWRGDSALVTGTSTAIALNNIFFNGNALPDGIIPGHEYSVEFSSTNVNFCVYDYSGGALGDTLFSQKTGGKFTVPDNCTGMIIRLNVANGTTVNEIVTPVVRDIKTNKEIESEIGSICKSIITENILMELDTDTTINLLDPSAITEDKILSLNVPVDAEGYYYSDYIEIGMTPFIHSQGGSVSDQVSCYDKDKNFIGRIAFNQNTDHYELIPNADADLRYVIIKPLDGTVFVRVNGGLQRPKVLCPFFAPIEYGADSFDLAYGKTFRKFGHKVAMFGDSITYGTDGNTSTRTDKNIPWWVAKITGWDVANYGSGGMGWVSTRYSDTIAYDSISSVDLSQYDVITLCYGVNDNYATMGTWDSTDEDTICGQVNKCINYIGTQNRSAIIILIATWNTAGSGLFPDYGYAPRRTGGFTRYELSAELEKIAEHFKIGFISQADSPLNSFGFSGTNYGPFEGSDGVHPSKEGYKAAAYWLTAKIKSIVS